MPSSARLSAWALQQMRLLAVRGPMSIGENRVGKAVAMAYPSAVFEQVVVQQIADELFGHLLGSGGTAVGTPGGRGRGPTQAQEGLQAVAGRGGGRRRR